MGYPDYDRQGMNGQLSRLSAWIDDLPANRAMTPMEQLLFRTRVKVSEEMGERDAALIGMTGQNPRKGVTHGIDDVEKEMLDIVVTALAGIEHIRGNAGVAMDLLRDHLDALMERMSAKMMEREGAA